MSVDNIVNVQITRQTTAPTRQGFGTALFLADTVPVGFTTRVKEYADLAEMDDDGWLLATHPAYKAAVRYFGQEVVPEKIYIGRTDVGDADLAASIAAVRQVNDDWYGFMMESHVKADILLVAPVIEALSKIYGCSSEDADLITDAATDVATALKAASYDRTFVMYSADQENYPEAAWFGRQLPQRPGSSTWKFKTLSSVTVDTLTSAQAGYAKGKNCNIYTTVGGVNMTEEGIMASGEFIDVMHGIDWLHSEVQTNVFTALVNEEKIPYTDVGAGVIENGIWQALRRAITYSVIAADPEPTVTVPLVATVAVADRAARLLPDVEFEGTLAGAIHKTTIYGTVSV